MGGRYQSTPVAHARCPVRSVGASFFCRAQCARTADPVRFGSPVARDLGCDQRQGVARVGCHPVGAHPAERRGPCRRRQRQVARQRGRQACQRIVTSCRQDGSPALAVSPGLDPSRGGPRTTPCRRSATSASSGEPAPCRRASDESGRPTRDALVRLASEAPNARNAPPAFGHSR